MKLVCGMTAHNEDWVIGLTVRAARLWADEVIVINHASTDATQQVLEEANAEVGGIQILQVTDPVFMPLEFYRSLVNQAWSRRATHVAILDADELLSANLVYSLRQAVESLLIDTAIEVPWIPVGGTFDNLTLHDRGVRTGFVFPTCGPMPYPELGEEVYNLHYSRLPSTVRRFTTTAPGALLHLFYLDERRLQAKELRWKMMEMLRWPTKHSVTWLNEYYDYTVYAKVAPVPVPDDWWRLYQGWEKYVHVGVESAVEKEVKKLWAAHSGKFSGLNTFGIV